MPAALAPILSDGPIIILVLLILTQTPSWFLNTLQLIGGFFILYLAWGAYKTVVKSHNEPDINIQIKQKSLSEATILNLLNPNPYIFWSTILGPIFIEAWRITPPWGLSFIIGFYTTMILVYIGFIILFGTARLLHPIANRTLSGISALALLGFGVYQIWSGVNGFFA